MQNKFFSKDTIKRLIDYLNFTKKRQKDFRLQKLIKD